MDLWLKLRHSRPMWLAVGWIFVGIGGVGMFVPLMPTVPFLLVASYCFQRGSPQLHKWLLDHPKLGPPLKDWEQNRVIRWPAKVVATLGLSLSLSYTCFFSDREHWVRIMVGVIGIMVILFILTRKSRPNGV